MARALTTLGIFAVLIGINELWTVIGRRRGQHD